MNERTIFLEALEKDNPEQRSAFLDEVCGENSELRQRVETLLEAHNDAGSFLEKTPEELDADSVFDQTVERSTGQGDGSSLDDAWQNLLTPSDDPERLGNLGPYEINELVGRGGMGVVLRAREPKLSRTVAVKLLAPELALNPVAVQRFLREARAAAAVSHDHVVAIHSIDDESHPPVIVMEFIQGQSLQQKIDKVGALDVKSILRIGMQTAAGLSAAHRQGLVHRDVKPANILLENGIERVKLTDFGLARAVDDISMTRTGQITGTPQYMSPEQAQGQRVDHRTDLFSLGCVLYAMCTGRAAFRADSAVAVMHRVVHDVPRPIREVNEDIPDWLCEIVEKLLAKDVDDRFASAEDVEDLLSRHLAHLQQPTNVPQPERLDWTADASSFDAKAAAADFENSARETGRAAVPKWLLWKFPAWSPFVVVVAIFGITMLKEYGPEASPAFKNWTAVFIFVVAMPLGIAMGISKLVRARFETVVMKNGKSSHTGFWFVLFALVPIVAAGFTKGFLGPGGPFAPISAGIAAGLAAFFLHRAKSRMEAENAPVDTPDHQELEMASREKLGRFVDIPEEVERDLRGVGWILTLVGMAAFFAPFGTYIISDQIEIPFIGSILGFFGLTSLLVFPIAMRAALDLNWLSITRRRPGAAMLLATSLAVVPWNPLLLLLLPWTIPAFRRVRRADVLDLIGVTESDPRVNSVFDAGIGLFRNRVFLVLFAMIVVAISFGNAGVTDIEDHIRGLFQQAEPMKVEELRPTVSITERNGGARRSPFFNAVTEFVSEPERRSKTWNLIHPYVASTAAMRSGASENGDDFFDWELQSKISGTSNSLRNCLVTFRDYIEEIAKETNTRITNVQPTDDANRPVTYAVIEYATETASGTIEMRMTGFEDNDLHGHQILSCGLHFEIRESAD